MRSQTLTRRLFNFRTFHFDLLILNRFWVWRACFLTLTFFRFWSGRVSLLVKFYSYTFTFFFEKCPCWSRISWRNLRLHIIHRILTLDILISFFKIIFFDSLKFSKRRFQICLTDLAVFIFDSIHLSNRIFIDFCVSSWYFYLLTEIFIGLFRFSETKKFIKRYILSFMLNFFHQFLLYAVLIIIYCHNVISASWISYLFKQLCRFHCFMFCCLWRLKLVSM